MAEPQKTKHMTVDRMQRGERTWGITIRREPRGLWKVNDVPCRDTAKMMLEVARCAERAAHESNAEVAEALKKSDVVRDAVSTPPEVADV